VMRFEKIWLNLAELKQHFGKTEAKFGKKAIRFGQIVLSTSCIPKNIQSPTVMKTQPEHN